MKIAFTICSNNYFAQAKVLISTLLATNPGYKFIVGLVDIPSELIDYRFDDRVEVICVDELRLNETYRIYEKFNIVELNTSVKASYFKMIKLRYPDASFIIYFDPDIAIFSALTELEKASEKSSIILTPHILTPIGLDEHDPTENTFLNYGTYNLGFIGLAFWDPEVHIMLDWWEERTLNLGFDEPCKGIFVDQLWINLVPIYFKNVKVLSHYGMNMAPWNLHERRIERTSNGTYIVNNTEQLIFYHFSSYSFRLPHLISKSYYSRYSFQSNPDLLPLYSWYQQELLNNNIDEISKINCYYIKAPQTAPAPGNAGRGTRIKNIVRQFVPPVVWKLKKKLIK